VTKDYFETLGSRSCSISLPIPELIDRLGFDQNGVIPVVTQDAKSKRVLMLGWMNAEALRKTIATGMVVYWDRENQRLLEKGKADEDYQTLVSLSVEGSGDSILCKVKQVGSVCPNGRAHRFFIELKPKSREAIVEGRLFRK
jgi:phosphoribosyl-AMP cyclohydrolase